MASTRKQKAALFDTAANEQVETKVTGLQRREFQLEQDDTQRKGNYQPSNGLKIKLDHLKTFEPLTDNQRKLFESYKRGDYFIGVLGTRE